MSYDMNSELRAALVEAVDSEYEDDDIECARCRALIDRTPDGPLDTRSQFRLPDGTIVDDEPDGDYETNDDHIVTLMEFFGLDHLA